VCASTAGSSREARVPDGFALEDGSGANRTKKAVRHARQRPAASSLGVFLGRSWRALAALPQVFARRLRGLLVLLLFLGLVLPLPCKNACVQRRVAGHAHFYCLSRLWLYARFGFDETLSEARNSAACGQYLSMTRLDDSHVSRLSSSKLLHSNRKFEVVCFLR
jgi:hypothetical protein